MRFRCCVFTRDKSKHFGRKKSLNFESSTKFSCCMYSQKKYAKADMKFPWDIILLKSTLLNTHFLSSLRTHKKFTFLFVSSTFYCTYGYVLPHVLFVDVFLPRLKNDNSNAIRLMEMVCQWIRVQIKPC